MSQYQPPLDPLNYSTPYIPQPSPRPTSVTVFAVLGIIFGSLGVLGMLCSIPQYFGLQLAPNPMMDGIRKDPLLLTVTLGSLIVGFVMSVWLLVASIGMLSLKTWARKAMVRYGIVYLVTSILSIILSLSVTNPRMRQVTEQSMQSNAQLNTPQMKTIMRYSSYGGVCFAVVFLLWPILIIYFMSKPHVKSAFHEQTGSQVPPTPGPM